MTEEIGTLRLRMVEPLDIDEAARTLARAGLLVPLTDWSARERKTPDGRMEATIADGAIEVVRVSGDSREVRWRGVYEAKGRKWVVREAPKESHTADTAYHDFTTDVIIFSTTM